MMRCSLVADCFRLRRQTGGGPKRGWRTGTKAPAAREGSPPGPPLNRRNKGATDTKKAAGRLVSAFVDRVAKPGRCCFSDMRSIGPVGGVVKQGMCKRMHNRKSRGG